MIYVLISYIVMALLVLYLYKKGERMDGLDVIVAIMAPISIPVLFIIFTIYTIWRKL